MSSKRKRGDSDPGEESQVIKLLKRLEKRMDAVEKNQQNSRHYGSRSIAGCRPRSSREAMVNAKPGSSRTSTTVREGRRNRRGWRTPSPQRRYSESDDVSGSENTDVDLIDYSDPDPDNISGDVGDVDVENHDTVQVNPPSAVEGGANNDVLIERDLNVAQDQEAVDLEMPVLEEIRSILVKDGSKKEEYAAPIQRDIASHWSAILAKGLDGKQKDEIMESYLPPENCKGIESPKINPEVKAAISEAVLKRDERLVVFQQQAGAALALIGKVLTCMVRETGGGSKEHMAGLSDAARLLADLHYSYSNSRRDLINLTLNKDLNDVLAATPIQEGLLFGIDLDGKVRAAKDLKRSGQQLKPQRKPQQKLGAKAVPFRAGISRQENSYRPASSYRPIQKTGPAHRQRVPTARFQDYQMSNQRRRQQAQQRVTRLPDRKR